MKVVFDSIAYIFNRLMGRGRFFSATPYELKNFLCEWGKCKIGEDSILIYDYKFEPSKAYPQIEIHKQDITSITLSSNPPKLHYQDDWIFIPDEYEEELEKFIKNNKITVTKENYTWSFILEPFLDTEFSEESKESRLQCLEELGVDRLEVQKIREQVSEQMYKYNFDTFLWEWCSLNLLDVLLAMSVKYNQEEFREFYQYAMDIENRAYQL